MAGSFVDCKLPGHQQQTRVRGEEAAGVGADSGFSGTSNAMLEKKIFTRGYGIQASDAGRAYSFLSRCIPQHLPRLWN